VKPGPSVPAVPAQNRAWQALGQVAAREAGTLQGHSAFLLAEIDRVDTLVSAAGEALANSLRALDEAAREQHALAMKVRDALDLPNVEENAGRAAALVSQLGLSAAGMGDHIEQIVRSIQFEDLSRQALQHCRRDLEGLQSQAAAWKGFSASIATGTGAESSLVAFNERLSELDEPNSRIRQVTSANLSAGEIELF
jgi:hypothetical protein